MPGSKLLSMACALPLAFAYLSPGSSCKEKQSTQSGNSNRPSANQVKSQANKPNVTAIPEGVWGGVHVHMQITNQGADIEYDCAHGKILEPLTLDREGRFQAKGTHVLEGPGPIRQGATSDALPASFTGNVSGKIMTLKVMFSATSEQVGTFTLTQGSEGRIRKCG